MNHISANKPDRRLELSVVTKILTKAHINSRAEQYTPRLSTMASKVYIACFVVLILMSCVLQASAEEAKSEDADKKFNFPKIQQWWNQQLKEGSYESKRDMEAFKGIPKFQE